MNTSRMPFAFWIGVAAAGVLLTAAFTAPPKAGVQPAAERLSERSVSAPLVAQPRIHAADCWITGDLVGDANPADVQRALCTN